MGYKADNAVIMAAGLSSRFAPLSYEKPKALIPVRGEVLIERQIRQLREAGIPEIYVVTGYKGEQFRYLEKKWKVKLIDNPEYLERNNNGSIYAARKVLKNSYLCSADNYFTENPFTSEAEDSYYAEVAPTVDYAFCSFDGTDEEAREHLKKIVSYGPKLAVASRGADGCILYDGQEYYVQKAVPIKEVVDTMGAGDSLITSFMVAYTDHLKKGITGETAIRESLAAAAEFASKVCGMNGAFGYGKKYE